MATTSIWKVTDRIDRVIDYATNPEKTENIDFSHPDFRGLQSVLDYTQQDQKTEKQFFVSGINCDAVTACADMKRTKRRFHQADGILAFHGYQSFAPGEASPETAHAIGVKLAQTLWGDRFEVVVSTHLDKHHLHNHYVLNSVSFMDGKRYYNNKKTYARMRRESDRLCREYALSVIENPKRGKSQHYAEWKAEQEDKPTWRGLIRADVDAAIEASMTFTQFLSELQKSGYEIKTGVKHLAVRPPGKDRFVRLRSIGDGYTEESIKQRILRNRSPTQPKPLPEPRTRQGRLKGSLSKTRRLTGLQALYFHYLYKMGILPHSRAAPKRTHFLLREDLRHLDDIIAQTTVVRDFDAWKDQGAYIRRNEAGFYILEPGDEYEREDGTTGVSYNPKKVFDISQTGLIRRREAPAYPDDRIRLKALMDRAPVPMSGSNALPDGTNALYKPETREIQVRRGMDGGSIFRALAQELSHAQFDRGDGSYQRSAHTFHAYCAAYMLCRQYGVAMENFRFDRAPEMFAGMEPQQVRAELTVIKEAAAEISGRMERFLNQQRQQKRSEPER